MARAEASEQFLVEQILHYLRIHVLRGDQSRELTDTTPLFEYRLLNSIRTAELLAFIRSSLGINVYALELTNTTLATARDLARAVCEVDGSARYVDVEPQADRVAGLPSAQTPVQIVHASGQAADPLNAESADAASKGKERS
jgi:acyl carrier protein